MKKYFKVIAKCGHVGRNNYIPIAFAVVAKDGKEAANKTRSIPRVKHHEKDAIISVEKIDYDEYLELAKINSNNPYLRVKSKQEQRLYCELEDLVIKNEKEEVIYSKEDRLSKLLKMRKIIEKSLNKEMNEYAY